MPACKPEHQIPNEFQDHQLGATKTFPVAWFDDRLLLLEIFDTFLSGKRICSGTLILPSCLNLNLCMMIVS